MNVIKDWVRSSIALGREKYEGGWPTLGRIRVRNEHRKRSANRMQQREVKGGKKTGTMGLRGPK